MGQYHEPGEPADETQLRLMRIQNKWRTAMQRGQLQKLQENLDFLEMDLTRANSLAANLTHSMEDMEAEVRGSSPDGSAFSSCFCLLSHGAKSVEYLPPLLNICQVC
jgi:hypothetical protein